MFSKDDHRMPTTPTQSQRSFFDAFQNPVWVIMMVLQMVLGLALIIALIMKFYMLVFGTQICTSDGFGIANLVRCTPALLMSAHFLIALAAVRFAAFFFRDDPLSLLTPFMLGLAGLVLRFIEDVEIIDASWSLAAVLLVLLVFAGAVFYGLFAMKNTASDDQGQT
jgi:hypothetical protein